MWIDLVDDIAALFGDLRFDLKQLKEEGSFHVTSPESAEDNRARNARWVRMNRDKDRERSARWRGENPEAAKASRAKWLAKNRDAYNARRREARKKKRDERQANT